MIGSKTGGTSIEASNGDGMFTTFDHVMKVGCRSNSRGMTLTVVFLLPKQMTG